jgi:hypothetical protein
VYAKSVATILKDDKKYKIAEPAIVISNDNYRVVQIKKNLEEYLTPSKVAPIQPAVPQQAVPQPVNPDSGIPKQDASKQGMLPGTPPIDENPEMEDTDLPNPTSPPKQ